MNKEEQALRRLRKLCLSLPETSEKDSWGHPNFRAGKKTFAAFEWNEGRATIAIHLADEAEAFLLQHEGSFAPPYGRGKWIGIWADGKVDWALIQDLVEQAYRTVALKRMIAALDQ